MEKNRDEKYFQEWGLRLQNSSPEELEKIEFEFREKNYSHLADYVREIYLGLEIDEAIKRLRGRFWGEEIPLYKFQDSNWLENFFKDLERIK